MSAEDKGSVFCHTERPIKFQGELKVSIQPSQMQFKEQQSPKQFHKSKGLKLSAAVSLQLGSNDRLTLHIQAA